MLTQRHRPIVFAGIAIAAIWVLAFGGYQLAQSFKMTAEKVRAYEQSIDFASLTGADRERALAKLEAMLNGLSLEERNKVWNEIMKRWFPQMTEDEKSGFLQATLPTNFKQTLVAFEKMPEDKRKKTIEKTLKNLRDQEARLETGADSTNNQGTNQPPITPELEDKIKNIGLKSYYSQSSAETKAELAPVLEEMQNVMQLNRSRNNPP